MFWVLEDMNMSKRLYELRHHDCKSWITMECCRISFHAKSPHTHTGEVLLYHPVLQSVLACVEVFLVTHTHTQSGLCFQCNVSGRHHVKHSVRWSYTLCPELCRRDVFVPSTGGGSRADLIVCTSKCSLQHQCAAPLHIMRKRLISALIANWLISLAQISKTETFFYPLKSFERRRKTWKMKMDSFSENGKI